MVMITVIIFFAGAITSYIFLTKNSPSVNSPAVVPLPTSIQVTPLPSITLTTPTNSPIPTPSVPNGWLTYTNKTLGFSISYPPKYKALDDKENLYGWKNGVVLIYKGGQSYDLVIQQWKSEAEYKTQYPNATSDLTVYKIESTFITVLNSNKDAEVSTIINTFKQL